MSCRVGITLSKDAILDHIVPELCHTGYRHIIESIKMCVHYSNSRGTTYLCAGGYDDGVGVQPTGEHFQSHQAALFCQQSAGSVDCRLESRVLYWLVVRLALSWWILKRNSTAAVIRRCVSTFSRFLWRGLWGHAEISSQDDVLPSCSLGSGDGSRCCRRGGRFGGCILTLPCIATTIFLFRVGGTRVTHTVQ